MQTTGCVNITHLCLVDEICIVVFFLIDLHTVFSPTNFNFNQHDVALPLAIVLQKVLIPQIDKSNILQH